MGQEKIIKYVYYGIVALLAIIAWVMIGRDDPKVDLGLWQGIGYTLIAAGVAIFFALAGLVTNFKGNLPNIIALGALVVAFFIFRAMASSEVPQRMADKGITSGVITATEAGVLLSIFLIVAAVVVTIISGVRGIIKQ